MNADHIHSSSSSWIYIPFLTHSMKCPFQNTNKQANKNLIKSHLCFPYTLDAWPSTEVPDLLKHTLRGNWPFLSQQLSVVNSSSAKGGN